jgi:hypothetical protein
MSTNTTKDIRPAEDDMEKLKEQLQLLHDYVFSLKDEPRKQKQSLVRSYIFPAMTISSDTVIDPRQMKFVRSEIAWEWGADGAVIVKNISWLQSVALEGFMRGMKFRGKLSGREIAQIRQLEQKRSERLSKFEGKKVKPERKEMYDEIEAEDKKQRDRGAESDLMQATRVVGAKHGMGDTEKKRLYHSFMSNRNSKVSKRRIKRSGN